MTKYNKSTTFTCYIINIIKKKLEISKINLELKYKLFLNATNPNIKHLS